MSSRIEKRGKYFLMIPGPSGGMQRVFIDVEAVRANHFSEVFQMDPRCGHTKPIRAHGVEIGITSGIDIASLIEVFEDISSNILMTMAGNDSITTAVRDATIQQMAPLMNIFRAIAAGEVTTAEGAVQDLMYDWMTAWGSLLERFSLLEQEASGMHVATEVMQKTMTIDAQTHDIYKAWAVVCVELLDVFLKLQTFEEELVAEQQALQERAKRWERDASCWDPVFNTALEFLDDPDVTGRDSFFIRAIGYASDSIVDVDVVQRDISVARDHISTCRALINPAIDVWNSLHAELQERVLELHQVIDAKVRQIADLRRRHVHYRDVAFAGANLPYQIKNAGITQEQYQHLEKLLADPRWSPDRASRRLKVVAQYLPDDLGPCPELPAQLTSSIKTVEEQIVTVEEAVLARVLPESKDELAFAAPAAVGPDSGRKKISGRVKADFCKAPVSSAASIDPLIQRLYDLMIIAAEVVTCKPHHVALSNVRALLEVASYLVDDVTKEQVIQYVAELRVLAQHPSCSRVVDNTRVTDAWRHSGMTWIWVSNPQRGRAVKLSQAGAQVAQKLRLAYGISKKQARAAQVKRTEDQRFNHQKRKRAGGSGSKILVSE